MTAEASHVVDVLIHVPTGTTAPTEADVLAYYQETGITEATVAAPSASGFIATERRIYELRF